MNRRVWCVSLSATVHAEKYFEVMKHLPEVGESVGEIVGVAVVGLLVG